MADRILVVDDVTGKKKRGRSASTPFVDQNYDATLGQTEFTVAQAFSGGTLIDVFVNGVLMREGVSKAFQRDTENNKIIFNSAVSTGAWVRVRVHL